MISQILLLIAGLVFIVKGADILVDGSSAIARKAGISEFVIGLTIVGMGTSAPEMVVSFLGAINGNPSVSLGNVIGSNIMNVLLITGITAILMPIGISKENKKADIPFNILIVGALFLLGMNKTLLGHGNDMISRIDGLAMVILFAAYMGWSFIKGKNAGSDATSNEDNTKEFSTFKSVSMIIIGLCALICGGNFFVDSATGIAHNLGISDKFIALTVLAGGTSLPELATCVVAAAKKKGQMALGNILGSNIFNVLLILGGSAMICPLSMESISYVDMGVLALSAFLLLFSAWTGKNDKVDRFDGTLFILCFVAYMVYLFKNL